MRNLTIALAQIERAIKELEQASRELTNQKPLYLARSASNLAYAQSYTSEASKHVADGILGK